jgi:hypothetical protein
MELTLTQAICLQILLFQPELYMAQIFFEHLKSLQSKQGSIPQKCLTVLTYFLLVAKSTNHVKPNVEV